MRYEALSDLYYLPNFITENEENFIFDKVNSAPKPKWVQLLNRRLQNWGGNPTKNGMILEPIPTWLQIFMDRIDQLDAFNDGQIKTNHVLVNEYLPGQGIMPHEDGPMFYPTIATISCGSGTVLKFERKPIQDCDTEDANDLPQNVSLYLERRSLVLVKGHLYRNYLHSIEELKSDRISTEICNLSSLDYQDGDRIDRDTRLSLTIRHALKVCKLKLRLGR
ncbi:unnamed protein product [Nesidiocoris tenuis]|uniref:Fe2OG dioxygenase domain-containing protein n=1 Tax=Nesidiocoris tenuis TaxID=355587 RepID=A0A6H5H4M2_9HEMI|nr:unnamed protein product [Nesidiocoris tenuis]